jgi:hypothetical protein
MEPETTSWLGRNIFTILLLILVGVLSATLYLAFTGGFN